MTVSLLRLLFSSWPIDSQAESSAPEELVNTLEVTLQLLKPQAITIANAVLARAAGAPLVVAGLALAGWSVAAAGENVMDQTRVLLTNGPYTLNRNPMYLAWTFIVLGVGLLVNSIWVLGAIPFALIYLHLFEIPREEMRLEEAFGEEYLEYKRRVRRYL